MKKFLIVLVFLLGFVLRIVNISSRPIGFTPDEASFGYDAYSILKTGKDQWGKSFPLILRSFGDFKLPLYSYLAIPSVAIFGLNEFAVRLPNAIIGSFAIIIVYLFVKELFKDKLGIDYHSLAMIASLLLAISPWHIPLSRGAFEANLTVFFLPLGVYLFLKAFNSSKLFILSALVFGLNLFSYHSARLITPLILIYLVAWKKNELKEQLKQANKKIFLSLSGLILLIFLVIAGCQLLGFGSARSADIAIFNPTDKWSAVADRRYEAILLGLSNTISRVFSNKVVYIAKTFIGNYFSYFSPQFLFTQGVGEWTYGMIAGRGVLYLIELVFVLFAIWHITKITLTTTNPVRFIIFWILVSVFPAALTKGPGYAGNRVVGMMPAIQILSAYGAWVLYEQLKKLMSFRKAFLLLSVAIGFSLIGFIEDYYYHAPTQAAESMLYGRKEAIKFVKEIENNYQTIIISRSLSEPQIYVAFFGGIDPALYQKESQNWMRYEREDKIFVDQLGKYSLGKYVFSDINYQARSKESGVLLVGKPDEFPEKVDAIKTIHYPSGAEAVKIIKI